MLGIISGSRKVSVTRRAQRCDRRIAPRLTIVPRIVASAVAPTAMTMLLVAARCHARLTKNCSYHRIENPTGGNEMKSAELNEIGTMITVGRNISTHTAQTTIVIA